MKLWPATLAFALLVVVPSPVSADNPHTGQEPTCDPDKIYAGEEFAFEEPFIFVGSEDGLFVDDVERAVAFLDLVDTEENDNGEGEGNGRKVTYIYAVYGTLGDLCET